MGDITPETVREAIANGDPTLEALSFILKQISAEMTHSLAAVLATLGVDPSTMPGEYLLQAVLVESDKIFKPIDRDQWLAIFDSYQQVKAIVAANPEIQAMMQAHQPFPPQQPETPQAPTGPDPLLDGGF